jgi:cytidylate kinase
LIVTVDGPAGSGKSTVARSLAAKHGFRYLDTGAMYRALAWLALERGTDLEDGPALAELGRGNPVDLEAVGNVRIAGSDVTEAIRLPEVDRVVSGVARHPEVRTLMRRWQRELSTRGDCVIEGRDIGRVVVPGAEIKVYLVADERVRVARRAGERPGHNARELASDLHRRDESDAAQMEPAPDAIEIDTTNLSVDEVVERIDELMAEKGTSEHEYLYGYTPRRFRLGQATIGNTTRLIGRLRSYGLENVPTEGGLVLAANHFSFVDPPAFGAACPRRIYFLAKTEVAYAPVLKQVLRYFGTVPVRRGESDREAVRMMREIARAGEMLGIFIEGTRQRTGVPGPAMPGAAMVALQEKVPVLPAAIRGSEHWRIWSLHKLTIAWGEPMVFDGLSANSKGYREATAEIAREVRRLWEWLEEAEAQGRPSGLTVPGR